jgi:cold shock CspA family protein
MHMRSEGKIVRIRHDRGFGFVKDGKTALEYFFHRSGCEGLRFETLTEGIAVTFTADPDHERGPRAVDVRLG